MGKQLETVSDFMFGGSKITADGDCKKWSPLSRGKDLVEGSLGT